MNVKVEKKEYVAPAMIVVDMAYEGVLCSSCNGDDCYEGDDDGDGIFGSVGIFGNDKA